jgi:hypothetical protein
MQPRDIVSSSGTSPKQESVPNLRVGVFWLEWGAAGFGVRVGYDVLDRRRRQVDDVLEWRRRRRVGDILDRRRGRVVFRLEWGAAGFGVRVGYSVLERRRRRVGDVFNRRWRRVGGVLDRTRKRVGGVGTLVEIGRKDVHARVLVEHKEWHG